MEELSKMECLKMTVFRYIVDILSEPLSWYEIKTRIVFNPWYKKQKGFTWENNPKLDEINFSEEIIINLEKAKVSERDILPIWLSQILHLSCTKSGNHPVY